MEIEGFNKEKFISYVTNIFVQIAMDKTQFYDEPNVKDVKTLSIEELDNSVIINTNFQKPLHHIDGFFGTKKGLV